MIRIITDSTADLAPELLSKYDIHVVPLSVYIDGRTLKDGVELDQHSLFETVDRVGSLPKTAAPTVADFIAEFSQSRENLYIGLSSKISSTLQNALIAAQSVDSTRTEVIDSLNLSTGIGLLVLKAAELRSQGKSLDEISTEIRSTVPKVRTSFVIETLRYLHMGGRCSTLAAVVGSALKIRPIIEVKPDGSLGVKTKTRGKRETALQSMLDDFKKNLPSVDLHRVAITHTESGEDAEYLAGELRKVADIDEIIITHAGAVIASHCGPKTIGILYLLK